MTATNTNIADERVARILAREQHAMGRGVTLLSFAELDHDVVCVVYSVEALAVASMKKSQVQVRVATYVGARQVSSGIVSTEWVTP